MDRVREEEKGKSERPEMRSKGKVEEGLMREVGRRKPKEMDRWMDQ